MSTDLRSLVVAMVTENLHRRRVDADSPISGDPLADKAAAEEYLRRIEVESRLIRDAVESITTIEDLVGELVSFAGSAVEMWALRAGLDARGLLQQIGQKYAEEGQ